MPRCLVSNDCIARCHACGWITRVVGFEAAVDAFDEHYLAWHHNAEEDSHA